MSRVLIAGAGYLGLALAERLQRSGHSLYLARRSAVSMPGMETIACDFTDPASLAPLPDVDAIYYAVAADDSSDDAYEKAYWTGLKNLIDHYVKKGQKPRFYLASSTSAYTAKKGEIVTEESETTQTGPSRFIVKGESYLLQSGLAGAVMRHGGIYGPGRTSMIRRIKDGLEKMTPGVVQYTNRIHRDDAVGIVEFLMSKTEGMQIYNVVDREPAPRDEVVAWVAGALGMDVARYPRDESKAEPRSNKRVLSTKLQERGYSYIYPSYREGYAPLLATI